ncbi:hypothetical protein Tco_0266247 [Tanacetum coccineum]
MSDTIVLFKVSNNDTAVAQRQLEDKQPEEKTNTNCLVKEQEKEYQTGWKNKMGNVLNSCNQRPTQQLLYKNMGFSKSGEYKKTFIGSGVGTSSMQVLHGFEFEVEPLGDHTFELARDRDQHLPCELFGYREDSNEAAFAVAAVEKIYAHESLTTIIQLLVSDDNDGYYLEYTPGMFIHLFLYIDDIVFSCGCKAEIWATKGLLDKAKGNVLGMEIIRDQSGNTPRVLQSRFYNEKLVHTLLEGYSILSLEDSLSGDCDVEKNGKWSWIYAVGSQEYQMVCTRLDIAFVDVGMLDKFDRGLQTDVQVFMDFDYAMGRSITVMGMALHKATENTVDILSYKIIGDGQICDNKCQVLFTEEVNQGDVKEVRVGRFQTNQDADVNRRSSSTKDDEADSEEIALKYQGTKMRQEEYQQDYKKARGLDEFESTLEQIKPYNSRLPALDDIRNLIYRRTIHEKIDKEGNTIHKLPNQIETNELFDHLRPCELVIRENVYSAIGNRDHTQAVID